MIGVRGQAGMTRHRRSRVVTLAVALVGLTCLLLVAAILLLRGSLAQLDGTATLPGLQAQVTIDRDALGVVDILAENETDALRALGFVHAQERYFEMDLLRRTAAGELAALFGPVAVEADRVRRQHRIRSRAVALVESLPPATRARLVAYSEGVNAGLDALSVRPWPYLLLRQPVQPWRAEDSALVVYAMFFDLNDSSNRRDLDRQRMREALPPALYDVLDRRGSDWDAPIAGESFGDATIPPPEAVTGLPSPSHRPIASMPAGSIETSTIEIDTLPGSNNWAVAGTLTADGRAILANDMHLRQRVPAIWFRARLRYPDPEAPDGRIDATGATLPGAPALVVGSNGRVAWGFTNSYGDWLDWFEVTWADAERTRYHTPEGLADIQLHPETIAVAGAEPIRIEVRETRWGPILHDLDDRHSLALAWTAHRPGGLDFTLTELIRARDLDQAMAIANRAGIPPQNFVAADQAGRIGWTLMGRIPNRVGACEPRLPIDPLTGCDWQGWVEADRIPRIIDPEGQRLWTANARVVGDQALALIGDGGYDLGARAGQIRDRLFASDRFDEADLLAIQLDDRALFLERWWRLLRDWLAQHGRDDPDLRELAETIATWEGRAATDAVSYRLVRAFRTEVARRVGDGLLSTVRFDSGPSGSSLGDLFGDRRISQFEGALWPLVRDRPTHLVPAGHRDWHDLLGSAARAIASELADQPGGLSARTWGERNTAAICHPLASALPVILRSPLCMPAEPLSGDSNMPRVQAPSFGASQRMVVAPGHERDGYFHMPGGASGHPLSPFWGAGHQDHIQGLPSPFLPGPSRYRLALHPTEKP